MPKQTNAAGLEEALVRYLTALKAEQPTVAPENRRKMDIEIETVQRMVADHEFLVTMLAMMTGVAKQYPPMLIELCRQCGIEIMVVS